MPSSSSTPEVSRRWLLIGVALVASLAGIVIYATGALQSLQNAAIDEGFLLAGAHPAPAGIVIVAVDNSTLQRIDSQLPIPRSNYARLLDVLHRAGPRLIGLDLQFIGTSADPAQDRALLGAFARDGPLLVSVSDTGTGVPTIAGVSSPPGVVPASGAVDTDSDGVLRKLIDVQVRMQTFAIRAAEMVRGRPIPAAQVPGNHAWIDFDGPPGTYPTYSMADVLDGAVPSSTFAGKIVLVGVTAPIGKDVFVTSASSKPMSGVEVQANSIETVLRGFPLQSSNPILSVALIIALALAPVLLSLRVSSLLVGLSSIALVVLFLGAAELAFAHGLILPVPDPIVGLGLATGGVIAVENLIERRKHRALQAFLEPFCGQATTPSSCPTGETRAASWPEACDRPWWLSSETSACSWTRRPSIPVRSGRGRSKRRYWAAAPCSSSSARTGSRCGTPYRARGGSTIPKTGFGWKSRRAWPARK
jgi:CHASE2 domain-containing sensor protein